MGQKSKQWEGADGAAGKRDPSHGRLLASMNEGVRSKGRQELQHRQTGASTSCRQSDHNRAIGDWTMSMTGGITSTEIGRPAKSSAFGMCFCLSLMVAGFATQKVSAQIFRHQLRIHQAAQNIYATNVGQGRHVLVQIVKELADGWGGQQRSQDFGRGLDVNLDQVGESTAACCRTDELSDDDDDDDDDGGGTSCGGGGDGAAGQ
jgi:hypothetical protein